MEKILWSPKIRPEKLWALYQSDAPGALDEDLLTEMGYGLFARCQSILMIRDGQVPCPRCGAVFPVQMPGQPPSPEPGSPARLRAAAGRSRARSITRANATAN